LLFYDLTEKETFQNSSDWLKDIQEYTDEKIVVMLIGNKIDLLEEDPARRQIPIPEIQKFTTANKLLYEETSAKNGVNVKESFELLIEGNFPHLYNIIFY
jgi:GTPase SAR1 family protein